MAPSNSKIAGARLQQIQRVMEESSRRPFIRAYGPADLEAVMHIVSFWSRLIPYITQIPFSTSTYKARQGTITES